MISIQHEASLTEIARYCAFLNLSKIEACLMSKISKSKPSNSPGSYNIIFKGLPKAPAGFKRWSDPNDFNSSRGQFY